MNRDTAIKLAAEAIHRIQQAEHATLEDLQYASQLKRDALALGASLDEIQEAQRRLA